MRIHYGINIASSGHIKRNVLHLLYVHARPVVLPQLPYYQPILDIDIIRIPVERGQYGRRPSPVYQHYPSHHRNIHGSHLDRRPESAGVGKVAETYKVRSVKVAQVFLGHRERSGADAGGWSIQVALITSVQHLAMT